MPLRTSRYQRRTIPQTLQELIDEFRHLQEDLTTMPAFVGKISELDEKQRIPAPGDIWIKTEGDDLESTPGDPEKKIPELRIQFGDPQLAGTMMSVQVSLR